MKKRIVACLSILENVNTNEVLMIKHNRGVNKGFLNFPGGKVDEGESISDANIRETIEETGLTPINAKKIGLLDFPTMNFEVHVFYTNEFSGELLSDSEEVNVFWQSKENIPLDKMRDADRIWVPKAFDKEDVNFRFFYDKNYKVEKVEEIS
jgi:8-oxo-dGTP diphosphatase